MAHPSAMQIRSDFLRLTSGALAAAAFPLPASADSPIGATIRVDQSSPSTKLDSAYAGFSFEKWLITQPYVRADNANLVGVFKSLGPSIIRVGGNSVDKNNRWRPGGAGGDVTETTKNDIDRFAAFVHATGWRVMYGVNFARQTAERSADEAAYAAAALGDSLAYVEIGNECDRYPAIGYRPADWNEKNLVVEWLRYADAIRKRNPGVVFAGPSSAGQAQTWTAPFADDVGNQVALLTHHYYRGDGKRETSTGEMLMHPDPNLDTSLQVVQAAAARNRIRDGYRFAEANNFYNGGRLGVSNGFVSALWSIDFLFTNARYGSTGVNFHGGGNSTGYTAIADDRRDVQELRPEFYGIFAFSRAARGRLLASTLDAGDVNLSAYAVGARDGSTSLMFTNKDARAVAVTVDLGKPASKATAYALTAPSLDASTGLTFGGSPIALDGSWSPSKALVTPVRGSTISLTIPSASAVLVTAG